jgi:hypothetical protein
MLGEEEGGMSDNVVAERLLSTIRDVAIGVYPFPEGSDVDARYAMAFALIAGVTTEALTAVHDGRPMSLKLAHGPEPA